MTDKIAELNAALAGLKAALEGMEGMLDEKLKMMLAFVEFLKKQDERNKQFYKYSDTVQRSKITPLARQPAKEEKES